MLNILLTWRGKIDFPIEEFFWKEQPLHSFVRAERGTLPKLWLRTRIQNRTKKNRSIQWQRRSKIPYKYFFHRSIRSTSDWKYWKIADYLGIVEDRLSSQSNQKRKTRTTSLIKCIGIAPTVTERTVGAILIKNSKNSDQQNSMNNASFMASSHYKFCEQNIWVKLWTAI